jgi:hypothetical protein
MIGDGHQRRAGDRHGSVLTRFFEEPGAHLLLDLDFIVMDADPEYLRSTYTKPEDVVARSVLGIVDDSTHGAYNGSLKASLERVVQTRTPDKMPVHRFDILRRTGAGEATEHAMRWLRVTNIPIIEDGEMTAIVQRIEDVTVEQEMIVTVRSMRRSNYVLYGAVIVLLVGFALGLSIAINQNNDTIHKARSALSNTQAALANTKVALQQSQAALAEVKTQARMSCTIQARGLPAGHELAATMNDIHKLLLHRPTTPAERRQAAQTSPAVRRVVRDLNRHLAAYQRAEHKQPHTRRC